MNEHIETVIIGAGQAGLSTAYHLRASAAATASSSTATRRVGDNWRQQWDTLRLYTPAKYDGLPGLPFPADPWSFPGKDEVADYLESLRPARRPAGAHRAPASSARPRPDGRLRPATPATGTHHLRQRRGRHRHLRADAAASRVRRRPRPVDPAAALAASTAGPASSQPGPVLVVGASHSGCDIAYEARGDAPDHALRAATAARSRSGSSQRGPALIWSRCSLFAWRHVLTRRTPIGRKEMQRGPLPRRPDAPGQARGPRRARRRAARGPGDRRPATACRCSTTARVAGRGATSSGAPASGRSSTGSTCRSSARTAGRGSTAASSTRCPACSSAACRSSTRSARWCFLGVGRDAEYVARRIDRAARLPRGRSPRRTQADACSPRVSSRERRTSMGVVDDLARAREAYERRDWVAAYDTLVSAPTSTAMQPDDLARLATAAYLARPTRTTASGASSAPTRLHLDARRDPAAAVRCAFWLAMVLLHQRRDGGRRRLGRRGPSGCSTTSRSDVVERGYLLIHGMFRALFGGDHEQRAASSPCEVADFGAPLRRPRPARAPG